MVDTGAIRAAMAVPETSAAEGRSGSELGLGSGLGSEARARGGGDDDNDDNDGVAARVVSIVDDMRLDENESAALRLAIACGDANIKAAVDLFK